MSANPSDEYDVFDDDEAIDHAMRLATRDAYELHKRLGIPIAVARGGQVVLIPPEEIEVPDVPPLAPRR